MTERIEGKKSKYDSADHLHKAGAKEKALVVVLNETRGSQTTLQPLIDTGLSLFEWHIAYCGAKPKSGTNHYAGVAEYMWEYNEPANWIEELEAVLPRDLYSFFLDTGSADGISSSSEHLQLWVSAWIQGVFRFRALENITSLGLEKYFDWIFLVRSDYLFTLPIVLPSEAEKRELVFMVGDSYGGLNDRFMGINSASVGSVKRVLDYQHPDFVGVGGELFDFLRGRVSKNPESLLWFQLQREGLAERASFVGQMGFCVRNENEVSRWTSGFWLEERDLFIKYPTEFLFVKMRGTPFLNHYWKGSKASFASDDMALRGLSKIVRAIGTQPRLLMAPMLAIYGEMQLACEVFQKSERNSGSFLRQLLSDLQKLGKDFVSLKRGERSW